VIYSWIWKKLPGNAIVKASISLLLLAGLIAILFAWVFPAIDVSLTDSPLVGS
jgi:hypothetical protein